MGHYNATLVTLSVLIAIASSYMALRMARRSDEVTAGARVSRWEWISYAAVMMGGGIWSMHFTGMLAFLMPHRVSYDFSGTIMSLAAAVGATFVAFFVAARWASLKTVILAGLLMGAGICGMHYIGMAAMRMAADIHYDPTLVAASYAIAALASIAGLWLAFCHSGQRHMHQLLGALGLGLAVPGMHYAGMAAATFEPHETGHAPVVAGALTPTDLAGAVVIGTFLLLFFALLFLRLDRAEQR